MRHGCACFKAIIGAKESIKCFMQKVEYACIGVYYGGSVLWRVVDRRYVASKWGCTFSISQREVEEEEGHPL